MENQLNLGENEFCGGNGDVDEYDFGFGSEAPTAGSVTSGFSHPQSDPAQYHTGGSHYTGMSDSGALAHSAIEVAWGDGSSAVNTSLQTRTVTLGTRDIENDGLVRLGNNDEQTELGPDVETTLAMNQAYQEVLDGMIARVGWSLQTVRDQQKVLQESIAEERTLQTRKQIKVPVLAYMPPYFKDSSGMAPAANSDTRRKNEIGEYDALVQPSKKFTKQESDTLRAAVRGCLLNTRLTPIISKKELLQEKITGFVPGAGNLTNRSSPMRGLKEQVKNLDRVIQKIRETPDSELLESEDFSNVDWMKIATKDFNGTRSAIECKFKWMNELCPWWNQKTNWTKTELEKLKKLVEEDGKIDWNIIAGHIGTKRTAFQCMEKYQSELNDRIVKRKWTIEEDDQLRQIIGSLRMGNYIPWEQVAYYMEGRTRSQCMTRFKRCLDPVVRRGRWGEEEDLLLMVAVQKFGARDWTKVSSMVPGRTDAQCRERWCHTLDATNVRDAWTDKEDELLFEMVKSLGHGRWAKISKFLPGRNPHMCKVRYKVKMESSKTKNKEKKRKRRYESSSDDESEDDFDEPRIKKKIEHLNKWKKDHTNKRIETVRDMYRDMVGNLPNPSPSQPERSEDQVLNEMPANLSRLIRGKLDAIHFKYRNKLATPAQAPRLNCLGPSGSGPKERPIEKRSKAVSMTAREISRRVRLEEELIDVVAQKDKEFAQLRHQQHARQIEAVTKNLITEVLGFDNRPDDVRLSQLPPMLASTKSLITLLGHQQELQQNTRTFPVEATRDLSKCNELMEQWEVSSKSKTMARKYYARLQNQFRSLFLWPAVFAQEGPQYD